jgi:hypothetical protein
MTWWDWFGVLTGAGGVVASILGAWHTYAICGNGRLTREMLERVSGSTQALIRGTHEDSQALIQTIHEGTQALIRRNQEDTQAFIREMQVETRVVLERMDQRADERQHEVFQAIQALRA